ncbi:hypothetical protein ABW20_dc0100414 [Dactylellina cionopaga]|nr:hypothetical protein ABW20_dc0100414 [Dactylellina cionopaga]
MSTSILSFPHEILSKIFSDSCLSNGDLGRAEGTCKLFQANIREYVDSHRRYIFRVDALGHPTWRLVRRLLKDPTLGERFVDITVKWERRIAADSRTWTSDWEWNKKETIRIEKICKTWEISQETKLNIMTGKNSEALLPLLLCFTSNLKSLDLGGLDRRIINYSHDESEHGLALKAIGGYPDGNRDWDKYYDEVEKYEPRKHTIFFFDNLQHTKEDGAIEGPKRLLPGLAGLEEFCVGSLSKGTCAFWAPDLFPVFAFPKIRSIEAFNGTDEDSGFYFSTQYILHAEKPCPVKYLTLESHRPQQFVGQSSSFAEGYLEQIAKITGNLQNLVIKNKRKGNFDSTKETDEKVGRIFLAHNKSTLNPAQVNINGGGFSNNGGFDEDSERKKGVAMKQRLFEKTQARLKSLKVGRTQIFGYTSRKNVNRTRI